MKCPEPFRSTRLFPAEGGQERPVADSGADLLITNQLLKRPSFVGLS